MKKFLTILLCVLTVACGFSGCGNTEPLSSQQATVITTTEQTEINTEESTEVSMEPSLTYIEGTVYHVGPTREHQSLTALFWELRDDQTKKTIYVDEGVYDIFKEYKELGVTSPPDDVTSPDYFDYNVFLPVDTNLIGIGNVRLEFAPAADEITYGESRTWSPLNILGACYIENLEIYCKNGRYCIHDDSHNAYQNSVHYYHNVRCTYEYGDMIDGERRLGFNNTIGNGMAQGTLFMFENCVFRMEGSSSHSAFYTHETGSSNPENAPTLIFKNCQFYGGRGNSRTVRLQNLATTDLHILTTFENCQIEGGIYLTIYRDSSAQHYDVTLIGSGSPMFTIDKPEENRYPIKVQ